MKISDKKPTYSLNQYVNAPKSTRGTFTEIKSPKEKGIAGEKVRLSKRACEINKIRDVIHQSPDVRDKTIASLREKIACGQYKPSAGEIAEKMLKEFLLE